jgi:hypothetical protein
MGIRRMVDIDFWTDSKVVYFTPEDKYFFLYLLTNPHTTQLGVYELNIRQCAFEMGYSEDAAKTLFDRFENKYGLIKRCGEEIAIKNFLRHSIVKGGKPVEDCLRRDMRQVKHKELISYVKSAIDGKEDVNETVKKVFADVPLLNKKNNKENSNGNNDNDNDNENEVSSTYRGRIGDVSSKPPQTRHKYGRYKNVLLSDKDLSKLKDEFSDWEQRIERLSEYMRSTGKPYKDHLATIRSWARRDKPKMTGAEREQYEHDKWEGVTGL